MELTSQKTCSPARAAGLGMSWPLLLAVLVLGGVLWHPQASKVLGDPDTLWHLRAGQYILEQGAVPRTDPFSHSMPGTAWTAHEWLAEVILAAVHRHAGWAGLVVMAALASAATVAVLARFLLQRVEPAHALLGAFLAAGMLFPHLLARPHVLAWPLLALWVSRLVSAVERRETPSLVLPALMVVWANLHGSFTLGLALAAVLAAAAVTEAPARDRVSTAGRWGGFLMLALLAALLTPAHWKGLWFTFDVMNMDFSLSLIEEWKSPNFQQPQLLELWLLLLLALGLRGRIRLSWWRILLLLGLLHLALKHQRNIPILGLLSPLLLATPFARAAGAEPKPQAQALDRLLDSWSPPARPLALLLSAGAAALVIAESLASSRFAPPSTIRPAAALEAVRAGKIEGPVFNAYNFGGYLIKEKVPVFIDGRADMYGEAFMKKTAEALAAHRPEVLGSLLDEYGIAWTLLPPHLPATRELERLPGWRRLYADEVAVVHVRSANETGELPACCKSPP